MINLTIQNTIQNTIKNTLGNLSEKFITQLFVPVGSDSFITADNKIFKVRVDMSTLLYLFAEDQRGVWYDPSDLSTMFQESTGRTAVTADGQPVGLMLDKSRGDVLGDELVTNGDFATGELTGFTYTEGKVVVNSNNQAVLTTTDSADAQLTIDNLALEAGKTYMLKFDNVSSTGTNTLVRVYSSADGFMINAYNPVGSYSYTFTPTSTVNSQIYFVQANNVSGESVVDNISVKEVLGTTATQPVATKRPTYNATPDRLTLDLVDDSLAFTVPTGGIDGYMVVGTEDGTASYGVSLPAGEYDIGGDYFMGGSVNGFLLREGDMSASDLRNVEKDFVSKGAKASYGDVTNFRDYWRDKGITEFPLIDTSNGTNFANAWQNNNLTSFPLIDTSSGINFSQTWRDNNLTEFPLIDTSSGTNFADAWRDNNLTSFPLIDTSSGTEFSFAWRNNKFTSFPSLDVSNGVNFLYTWYINGNLTDFPANMFDNCSATRFDSAFAFTNLSQSSIDGILVSIESNGTSNGIFGQSGGSAPGATGEAAIDALRSRGWTITVTGGY